VRGLESGEREKGKREEGSREREREEFQERMREGGNKKYVESDKGEMEREGMFRGEIKRQIKRERNFKRG